MPRVVPNSGTLGTTPVHELLEILLLVTLGPHLENGAYRRTGDPKENIAVWSENGIEYVYRDDLVASVSSCRIGEWAKGKLESDPIEINGIRKSKMELAKLVADAMTASTCLLTPEREAPRQTRYAHLKLLLCKTGQSSHKERCQNPTHQLVKVK